MRKGVIAGPLGFVGIDKFVSEAGAPGAMAIVAVVSVLSIVLVALVVLRARILVRRRAGTDEHSPAEKTLEVKFDRVTKRRKKEAPRRVP